jgi:hypothetical protein
VASTVTVTAINDTPVAVNDVATIEVTMAADVIVKGNDSDPDNSTASLTVTIVSFSAGITSATVNPDGTIHVQTGVTIGNETVVYYVTDANGAQSANATLAVTVSASAPPSGTDASTTIIEDGGYTYGTSDFGFVPVNMAQTFDAIQIVTLPASGTLWLNGSPVLAGDVVTVAQLGAGQLRFTPAADGNGSPYTAFTFQVRDNFGTYASSPNTFTVNITAVNDAPVLSGDNDFVTITEDDAVNPGQLVSSLINSSDAESGAANGIAIHGLTTGNGSWQYSVDGGSNWTDVGSVSTNAALLLRASDYLRFVPDGDNADSASLSFYAWDATSGVAGGSADVTVRGGTTAFSSAGGASAITVNAVNDAPLLGVGQDFIAITEDDTANAGQLVSSLFTSSDIDAGALSGIAIDSADSGRGTWEFSTDGGTNWNSIGSVSGSSALLLRSTDRVRFVPDGQNADEATIGFRAWDQSTGAAGNKVDVDTHGGTTAFSIDRASAAITVTGLNDAPVIGIANDFVSISEDDTNDAGQLVSTLLNSTDADDVADSGIAIHGQSAGNGAWQYSLDGGNNWSDVSAVSNTTALLLRSTDRLRFVPDGRNADAVALTFYAWDQTTGTAGAQVDASVRGGTTAFSLTDGTSNLTVSAVNDAPLPHRQQRLQRHHGRRHGQRRSTGLVAHQRIRHRQRRHQWCGHLQPVAQPWHLAVLARWRQHLAQRRLRLRHVRLVARRHRPASLRARRPQRRCRLAELLRLGPKCRLGRLHCRRQFTRRHHRVFQRRRHRCHHREPHQRRPGARQRHRPDWHHRRRHRPQWATRLVAAHRQRSGHGHGAGHRHPCAIRRQWPLAVFSRQRRLLV